jgi:hypothetical protein
LNREKIKAKEGQPPSANIWACYYFQLEGMANEGISMSNYIAV